MKTLKLLLWTLAVINLVGAVFVTNQRFNAIEDKIEASQPNSFGATAIQAQTYYPTADSATSAATTSNFIGSILPSVTNAFDLGSPSKMWRNVYIGGSITIPVNNTANAPFGINSSTPGSDLSVQCTGARPCVTVASGTTQIMQISGTGNNTTTFSKPVIMTQAQFGPLNFPTDSGPQAWVDELLTSATAINTLVSYSARIAGTSILTVAARANGSTGVVATSTSVGINTTTPGFNFTSVGTAALAGLTTASITSNLLCWNTTNGEVRQQATTCTVSSARYKEYISSLSTKQMAEIVRKLRPVQYLDKTNKKESIGFIAEEVAEIFPMLAVWTTDYTKEDLAFVQKNYPNSILKKDGKILIPQTVDYEKMSVILVGAYQDMDDRVSALEKSQELQMCLK